MCLCGVCDLSLTECITDARSTGLIDTLLPGTHVQLHGLSKEALNGQRGKITGAQRESPAGGEPGRWPVTLEKSTSAIAVKSVLSFK